MLAEKAMAAVSRRSSSARASAASPGTRTKGSPLLHTTGPRESRALTTSAARVSPWASSGRLAPPGRLVSEPALAAPDAPDPGSPL